MLVPTPAFAGAGLVLIGVAVLAALFTDAAARLRQEDRTRLQVLAWARYEVVVDSPGLWAWRRGTAPVRALVQGRLADCVVRERNGQPWVGLVGTGIEVDRRPLV